jgi:FkbM family methyltransferase
LKNKNLCKNYTLFPHAISKNNKTINLNLCRKPQVSSTYSPLSKFTDLFPDSGRFDVINKIKISAKKLDSFKIRNPDFIKLDIQGGELNALKGADKEGKTFSFLNRYYIFQKTE